MRLRNALTALAVVVTVAMPAALRAQDHGQMDFTGMWELEFPAPWGVVVWTFDLEQDGEALTGESKQGMGTLVLTGTVKDHEIEFSVDLHDGPHALSMGFGGSIEAGKIGGEVSFENGETGDWTLTRVET